MYTIVKKAITDTIPAEESAETPDHTVHQLNITHKQSWVVVDFFVLLLKMMVVCFESLIKLLLPPQEKPLLNETVLVTGSGSGIGREIAMKFACEGARVVCVDKNEKANKETEDMLRSAGATRIHSYTCDVACRNSVQEQCRLIENQVGRITILVNNAGILKSKRFSSQTSDDVIDTFSVNVFSQFWMLECILPEMRKNNHGHVVAISSMCGVAAIPNLTAYCASKYAVRGLMDSLYEEIRAEDPNSQVKFTAVYPYMVDTGLIKKPKTRFPEMLKLLTPGEVAEQIVKAVKQDCRELSIPFTLLHTSRIMRFLPNKMVELIKDFFDTGVDPDE